MDVLKLDLVGVAGGDVVVEGEEIAAVGELGLPAHVVGDDVVGAGLADHLDDLLLVQLGEVNVNDLNVVACFGFELLGYLFSPVGVEAGDGGPGDGHRLFLSGRRFFLGGFLFRRFFGCWRCRRRLWHDTGSQHGDGDQYDKQSQKILFHLVSP